MEFWCTTALPANDPCFAIRTGASFGRLAPAFASTLSAHWLATPRQLTDLGILSRLVPKLFQYFMRVSCRSVNSYLHCPRQCYAMWASIVQLAPQSVMPFMIQSIMQLALQTGLRDRRGADTSGAAHLAELLLGDGAACSGNGTSLAHDIAPPHAAAARNAVCCHCCHLLCCVTLRRPVTAFLFVLSGAAC